MSPAAGLWPVGVSSRLPLLFDAAPKHFPSPCARRWGIPPRAGKDLRCGVGDRRRKGGGRSQSKEDGASQKGPDSATEPKMTERTESGQPKEDVP